MSREIKFRAYQKTPSLNHKPGLYEVTGLDFYEGDCGGGEVCLRNKKGEQWTEYIKDVVLEQSTGLLDRNGKEIYEGDIVRYKLYADSRLDYIDEVFYSTISGAFMVGDEDNIKTLDCLINVEVIDNIHEPLKDFRPEHLKRMGVSICKGGEE